MRIARLTLLHLLALALLVAVAVLFWPARTVPLIASETTEEAVQTGEVLCEQAPAAAELGSAISSAASAQAGVLDALGAVAGAPSGLNASLAVPPTPIEQRTILPFSKAQEFTTGKGGAISAHHILEQRHIKSWGQQAGKSAAEISKMLADAPSVVLLREEHLAANKTIEAKLPCGKVYSKAEVWAAYQEVYQYFPHWLEAIAPYIV
jgi:hypothetical protein